MATILVLDDILDAGNMVKRLLEQKDHTVHVFTEEEEVLEFAQKNKIDLAILDIHLKKMNGVEVLEELRSILPDMGAIMLTGYPTLETARDAYKLGAAEYCVKPIDIDDLEEKVERVLGKQ